MPFADGALIHKKFQDLVPKELFKGMCIVEEIDAKSAIFVKGPVAYDDLAVRIEGEKISEGLDGADTAGDRLPHAGNILLQALAARLRPARSERLYRKQRRIILVMPKTM